MAGHRAYEWDDEPWGDADEGKRRRWRRPWNAYLAIMLGFVGLILFIGSVRSPGLTTAGSLLVLLSPVAVTRSDGPRHRPGHPRPAVPTPGEELSWLVVAAALVAVGIGLFVL